MVLELKLRSREPNRSSDIYGSGAVALCATCSAVMGTGYPLWGVHLQAAITLHAAHRAVADLADIPALTDDDRRLGRRLTIGGV